MALALLLALAAAPVVAFLLAWVAASVLAFLLAWVAAPVMAFLLARVAAQVMGFLLASVAAPVMSDMRRMASRTEMTFSGSVTGSMSSSTLAKVKEASMLEEAGWTLAPGIT